MKKEKYTTYAPSADITFIMVDIWDGADIVSRECIGWYYGEPNEWDNVIFSGQLKATYQTIGDQ